MYMKAGCVLVLAVAMMGCSKKQEVIFEAQTVSYPKNIGSWAIEEECAKLSKDLSSYISDGWKVVASSAKERMVFHDMGKCIGTEYIIEK